MSKFLKISFIVLIFIAIISFMSNVLAVDMDIDDTNSTENTSTNETSDESENVTDEDGNNTNQTNNSNTSNTSNTSTNNSSNTQSNTSTTSGSSNMTTVTGNVSEGEEGLGLSNTRYKYISCIFV